MGIAKGIFSNFKRYSFLVSQLIIRDFKIKYKRSVLGILWSLLYPLLMMSVMALVFSQMFRFSVEGVNYLVYLMTGLVMFNFFSEATNHAMVSVVQNFNLINKIYIPKYIFPLSKCLFVGINFLLTLIPLFLIILVTGSGDTKVIIDFHFLMLPFIFLFLFMFILGIGLLLSTMAVFLRDTLYIYGILLTIWQYLTPIFYDISMLPRKLQAILQFNPLFVFINSARQIILFNNIPSLFMSIMMLVYGVGGLILGGIVFKSRQDRFIYYY